MLQNLDLDAELVITVNNIPFLIVAEENYIVVNFKEFNHLDQLMKVGSAMSSTSDEPKTEKKGSGGGPLKKLGDLNTKIREMGVMVELRVGTKTYAILGGNSPSIKAAAIFGKIGSFFGR